MSGSILFIDGDMVTPHGVVDAAVEGPLAQEGYEVRGARTAEAARSVLERPFELIVLASRLPDGDGLQLLREIREKHTAATVLVLSGHAPGEDPSEAVRLGATDFVRKPCELRELHHRIHKVLETAKLRRERDAAHAEACGCGRAIFELPQAGVDLELLEKELLVQAIARTKGNKTRAGKLLGLNRDQIRYRLEKYGLATDGAPASDASASNAATG
jgi:DNA-binding NtrC family response regulator